jgi:hypothetical protein
VVPTLSGFDTTPTLSVFMITHTIEVIVWALAYWIVEATPPGVCTENLNASVMMVESAKIARDLVPKL